VPRKRATALAEAGETEVRCNEKIIHNDSGSDTSTGAQVGCGITNNRDT